MVLLVLVKLVLVGWSVLSVVLMRRRRLVVLVVVVAIGLGHGEATAAAAETRWHGVDEVLGVRTVAYQRGLVRVSEPVMQLHRSGRGERIVEVVRLGVVHAHRHGGFVQTVLLVRHAAAAEMMHERVMMSRGGQGEVLLMLHRELLLLLLDVMRKRRRGQMARQLGLGRQRQVVVRVTVQKARLQLPASVAAR